MKLKAIVWVGFLLSLTLPGAAQGYGAYRADPWNDGKGATLRQRSGNGGGYAEVYGSYIQGNLRSSSEAGSAWTAGARTGGLKHFDRVSLTGQAAVSQTMGYRSAGSLLSRPASYLFDFYEFSPALKIRQDAELSGGLCQDLSAAWQWGIRGKVAFSKIVKQETLAHNTSFLSSGLRPGIQYRKGSFAMAASYQFSYEAERIRLNQELSPGEDTPTVFFDEGLFYGSETPWYLSPIHSDEGFLVRKFSHGAAFQLSEKALYAGLSSRWSRGEVWANAVSSSLYDFSSWDLDGDLDWSRGPHRLHASVDYLWMEHQPLPENDPSASRLTLKTALQYGFVGRGWSFAAVASLLDREGCTLVNARYRVDQQVLIPALDTRWTLALGQAGLRLAAGWTCGTLSESGPSLPSGTVANRLDRYFVRYREHMVSHKIVLSPGVRWRFGGGLYADAALWWNHGFRLEYLGADRISGTLAFGYEF